MYINIGKSKINYQEFSIDNFMILSEVVNSKISFEKPTLVNNINELDIWFGRNFDEYNYFKELLNSNISLYLYRPISSNIGDDKKDIDLRDYIEDDARYFYNSNFTVDISQPYKSELIKNLPKIPDKKLIYKILSDEDSNDYISKEGLKYNKFIYLDDAGYVNLNAIEDKTNTKSFNNRDTLYINSSNLYYSPSYIPKDLSFLKNQTYIRKNNSWYLVDNVSSPRVKYSITTMEELSNIKDSIDGDLLNSVYPILNISIDDIKNIENKLYTLAWKILDWRVILSDYYICFYMPDDKIVLLKSEEQRDFQVYKEIIDLKKKFGRNIVEVSYSSIDQFILILKSLGFIVDGEYMYSLRPIQNTYFFSKEGFIEPSYEESQNIIQYCIGGKEYIKFWSKTIGESNTDEEIKITITKIEKDFYTIKISRFDYFEIFEGTIKENTKGFERLDRIISRKSRLVYCNIIEENLNKNIEGTWKLHGGISEDYSISNYNNSINTIINSELPYPIDFILIPDIDKYNGIDFLEIAKKINCQILLQNNNKNYKNNIIDKENRLIYFYNGIKIGNENRPGYYIYFKGLVRGIFSETSNKIYYDPPFKFNPTITEEELEEKKKFEKYKSNYLTYNGQYYFYETYLDGENYETTGWMRFAISKISRELEKQKRYIIGLTSGSSRVEKIISRCIGKIKDNFSIIDSINIINCLVDFNEGIVLVRLETIIDDLVKSNLTIDITINYNNKIK